MKDMYDNNFKSLNKESEDLRKWSDLPSSWIGRFNTVKNSHPTKVLLKLMQSSTKSKLISKGH